MSYSLTIPKSAKPNSEAKAGFSDLGRLVGAVSTHVKGAVSEIETINLQTRLLAFNAQIEAARSGAAGNAFGVVAREMGTLAERIASVVSNMSDGSMRELNSLTHTLSLLSADVRGTRLSDLALTNIDLIDRNLYERSCDVRWWATDQAVVDALAKPSKESAAYASKRLGVILDSYTVYYDIVLCDHHGEVIANGRPEQFSCVGSRQGATTWFRSALATRSGQEFGFESLHRSNSLANGKPVLVYSCTVREGGEAKGKPLGVLGIIFNWESLAQTIAKGTLLPDEEKEKTRVCIVDESGLILADSRDKLLMDKIVLRDQARIFAEKKGHYLTDVGGQPMLVAHAASPGYETYRTGFHSLILQQL